MQTITIPRYWAANPIPILSSLLRAMIRIGKLTIIDANGRIRDFGDHRTGPSVTLRFKDHSLPRRLVLNPSLAFGEAYMDGRLTIERGTLRDFLFLASKGPDGTRMPPGAAVLQAFPAIWRAAQPAFPLARQCRASL